VDYGLADGKFSFFLRCFLVSFSGWWAMATILYLGSSRFSGFSASIGRVESSVRQISRDLVGFRVRSCGFMSVSSDLWLTSLSMVATMVRWSFGALS
jgi:hypothetical protein